MGEAHVRVPQRRVRWSCGGASVGVGSRDVANVKPPYLADLEIESIKKFVLDYKSYSQKCPGQLLRNM